MLHAALAQVVVTPGSTASREGYDILYAALLSISDGAALA